MKFQDYVDILVGLLDGSRPLPPPHPQRLNFPSDPSLIEEFAGRIRHFVEHGGIKPPLTRSEIAHLTFKLAAWFSKTGKTTSQSLGDELHWVLWLPLTMVLSTERKWVTSRAGIAWVMRYDRQWHAAARKAAREAYADPPKVATIDRTGFYLVELTNGAHVYCEGHDMGHCMSTSINDNVLKRRGFPVGGPDALASLTYAVKIRSREVRIFSVRNPDGKAVMTIEYSPKRAAILFIAMSNIGPKQDLSPAILKWQWEKLQCDVVLALAEVVPVKICYPDVFCDGSCIRRDFCRRMIHRLEVAQ